MLTQIQAQLHDLKQRNLLAKVARSAGLSDRTLYRIAKGDTRDSRISTLTKIVIAIQAVEAKEKPHRR